MTTAPTLPERWGSKEIWLRALQVRCGLIWHLREELTDLELGLVTSTDSVLTEAYRIANEEAASSDSLDEAFQKSVTRLLREIDHLIESHGEDNELRRLRKAFEEAQTPHVLECMFDFLSRQARNVYRSAPCRKTILYPDWLNEHPRGGPQPVGYPDPYHVNAQTLIAGNTARVDLQVHLDRFDAYSMLAVPALLTHELICHAHAREDRSDSKSWWAEGVMDWVASFLFDWWVMSLELPYGAVRDHGSELWNRRMTVSRRAGRIAAQALVQWLLSDLPVQDPLLAQRRAVKLALQVNVIDAPLLDKDRLASRFADIKHQEALQRAIRAWHSDDAPATVLLSNG